MKKNYFKIVLLTLSVLIYNSCTSDEEEENLSFTITNNERFAPSEIRTINSTTNHLGTYTWEIEHDGNVETSNMENLNFTATKSGEYLIKLTSSLGNETSSQSVIIQKPSNLILNKVTLKDIPQSYNDLYFKIKKIELINGIITSTYIYTTPTRQNISVFSPQSSDWNIDSPYNIIPLSTSPTAYVIEFYTANNVLVTKIQTIGNFVAGLNNNNDFETDRDIMTTSTNCQDCDYFEIYLDYEYSDY